MALLALALTLAGCGNDYTLDDIEEARKDGEAAATKRFEEQLPAIQGQAYQNGFDVGRDYALNGEYETGRNYIVDFIETKRGQQIRLSVQMPLGVPIVCDTLDECFEP